jgi:hypothetical protein
MTDREAMTTGMKITVFAIFISVIGLAVGFIGLLTDWQLGKRVGIGAGALLALVLWLTSNVKDKTLDRFLFGRKD